MSVDQKEVLDSIAIAIIANQPFVVWGPPGVGKTASIEAITKKMGFPMVTIIPGNYEQSDMCGIPFVSDNKLNLAPPGWVLEANRLAGAYGKVLVFMDELSCARHEVQASALRIMQERVVGDVPLHPQVRIGCAANPPEMAASGWDLSAPMANRLIHLDWKIDVEAWVTGLLTNWGDIDEDDEKHEAKSAARGVVASYINVRQLPGLFRFPDNDDARGRAWPSPRSWHRVAQLIPLCEGNKGLMTNLVAGCIGIQPAGEFITWMDALDLPNPEDLIKDPDSLKLPERADQVFVLCTSVAAAVMGKNTKKRWEQGFKVLVNVAKAGKPDFAAFAARTFAANEARGVEWSEDIPKVFGPLLSKIQGMS